MLYTKAINKVCSRPPTFLRVIMWILFFSLLFSIYGDWLLHRTMSPPFSWLMNLLGTFLGPILFILFLFPTLALYAGQTSFLVLWCVGLSACTLLWIVSQRGWIGRAISFVPLGLLVIAPFAVPAMYGSYNTLETFEAPPGYAVHWLTRPESSLAGAIRRAQYKLEIDSLEYCLLGWSDDNKLYYSKRDGQPNCIYGDGNALWLYEPVTGTKPERIKRLTDGFVSSSTVLKGPRHPEEAELRAKNPNFVEISSWAGRLVEESTSPDGTMKAAVIQDWSHRHYEVIVMKRADP